MALGELKCPSLEYVNNMTWAEFQIRLFSYNRVEKNKWFMIRELMYNNTRAPHLDPKRIPKTIDKFMSLKESKKDLLDIQKKAIQKAIEDYKNRNN